LADGPLIIPRRPSPYSGFSRGNFEAAKRAAEQDRVRRYVRYGLGATPQGLPGLEQDCGRATVLELKDRMAEAGMPRTSHLAGGEVAGLMENDIGGSTGYSVQVYDDHVRFHTVLSGQAAGLQYRHWEEYDDEGESDELHAPVNPEKLIPKIAGVFAGAGLTVREIRASGYQMKWDDDTEYEVLCDRW